MLLGNVVHPGGCELRAASQSQSPGHSAPQAHNDIPGTAGQDQTHKMDEFILRSYTAEDGGVQGGGGGERRTPRGKE